MAGEALARARAKIGVAGQRLRSAAPRVREFLQPEADILNRFLCLLGARKGDRCRYPDRRTLEAMNAYERLSSSPWEEVTVPIRGADGRTWNRTLSIDSIALTDGRMESTWRQRAHQLLSEVTAHGAFSFESPGEEELRAMRRRAAPGSITGEKFLDGTLFDPRRVVAVPTEFDPDQPRPAMDTCSYDRARTPEWWPVASRFRDLYVTRKAFDPRETTDAFLSDAMERAIACIDGILRARNCNPAFHSVMIAATRPPYPELDPFWGNTNTATNDHLTRVINAYLDWRRAGVGRIDDWKRHAICGWLPPVASGDPTQNQFRITGPSNPLWRKSLSERLPLTYGGRPDRQTVNGNAYYLDDLNTFQSTTFDGLLDVYKALVCLVAIVDCGDYSQNPSGILVDINVVATTFNALQRQAYQQIGQPYGTDFGAFDASIAEERAARERHYREGIVAAFGGRGYRDTGDDATLVCGSLLGTVGLAIAAAAAAGPLAIPFALFVSAWLGAMALGDPRDRIVELQNPSDAQLLLGPGSSCAHGLRPRDVLRAWPFLRMP